MTSQAAPAQSKDVFPQNALLIRIMLLFLGGLVVSLYSIYFLRQPGSAAFIWYTNGFSIAMIALAPTNQRVSLIGTVFVAILLSNLIFGDAPGQSIQLAMANIATIIAGSLSLAYISRIDEPFLSLKAFGWFVVATVLISPAIGALFGGWTLHLTLSVPLETVVSAWYLGDVIGILAITPLIYTLLQRKQGLPSTFYKPTTALTIIAISALSGWLLSHVEYPFIAIAIALTVASAVLDRLSAFFTAFIVSVTLDLLLVSPDNLMSSAGTTELLMPISGAMLLGGLLAVKSARLLQIQKISDERATLFSNAMQSSVIGTVMVQSDGKMSNPNNSFVELIGYTHEELDRKTFRQLVFHRDRDATNEQLYLLTENKIDSFKTEIRLTRKNKQVIWTRIGVSVVRDKWHGNVLHFIYQVQDIDKDQRFEHERNMWSQKFEFALGINRTAVYEMECHTKFFHLSGNAILAIGVNAANIKRLYEWMSRIHPDDLREYQHTMAHCGGKFGTIEYRLMDESEKYRWVRDHCRPIEQDSHGVTTKVIGTITDIDDERERSLQKALSSKQVELIEQVGELGIWEYEPHTATLYWNREMYALYGISEEEEITLETWRERLLDADRHPFDTLFNLGRIHNEHLTLNIQVKHTSDLIVNHSISARIIHAESGTRLAGFCQETTRLQKENVVLTRENQLLSAAIESVNDGIIVLDSLLRITFINQHAAELTGYPASDLIGSTIDEQFNVFDHHSQYAFAHLLSDYHQDFCLSGTFTLQTEQFQETLVYLEATPVAPHNNATNGWVLTFRIQDALPSRAANSEGRYSVDPITKFPGKRAFEQILQNHTDNLHYETVSHVLVMIELKGLETLADAFGDPVKDQLIKSAAILIKSYATKSVARLSESRFGLLLENQGLGSAQEIMSSLSEKICALKYQPGETAYHLECVMGMTLIEGNQKTPFQIIYQAQVAMESVSDDCHPAISVFDPSSLTDGISFRRDFLLQRIDIAITNRSFSLLCMPIMSNRNGLQNWHEVLVRLITEEGQLLLPAEFLPAAEPTGRLISIERWVFNEVLNEQAQTLAAAGLNIAINISASAFYNESFIDYCLALIKKSNLPSRRLCIEIKESTLLIDTLRAKDVVSSLRKLGCEVAVDNFGTELTSFSYLRKFNVSIIKIDGSLIAMMKASLVDRRIVESIKQISDSLRIKTAAQKVNSDEDLRLVQAAGLDYIQGYVFGDPLPLARVISSAKAGLLHHPKNEHGKSFN
ncbi:EAL domain-containing protein [Grimontia hollisae]|uniref:EAL domain-containing protein n=1 Tax=Grimontia hollisae TaxID=673 RepID=UPI0013032B9F|nr:EAL domain-containing protein [Grimontia hollisae]MDF2184734.1 EAL domain-containing protein [Grimontia hollisae]